MSEDSHGIKIKGPVGLIIAIAVVVALIIGLPAYRWFIFWFLMISVLIGLGVAAILFLWHRYKPIEAADVENKRPLGLD